MIAMEDVIEHIIGQEIFEDDDPAVDMRDLARRQQLAEKYRIAKKTGFKNSALYDFRSS